MCVNPSCFYFLQIYGQENEKRPCRSFRALNRLRASFVLFFFSLGFQVVGWPQRFVESDPVAARSVPVGASADRRRHQFDVQLSDVVVQHGQISDNARFFLLSYFYNTRSTHKTWLRFSSIQVYAYILWFAGNRVGNNLDDKTSLKNRIRT